MEPDRLDRIASTLFDAARTERPRAAVKNRALELASSSEVAKSRRALTTAIGAAVAAVSVAAAVWLGVGFGRSHALDVTPQAEPETWTSRQAEPAPLPEASTEAPQASESARPTSRAPVAAESAPAPVKQPTLADEVHALEAVRAKLGAGDATGALRALDEYARKTPKARMGAEATLLRIEALSRAGRTREADALARRFVQSNPDSSLSDRARAFVLENDAGKSSR